VVNLGLQIGVELAWLVAVDSASLVCEKLVSLVVVAPALLFEVKLPSLVAADPGSLMWEDLASLETVHQHLLEQCWLQLMDFACNSRSAVEYGGGSSFAFGSRSHIPCSSGSGFTES